MNLRKSIQNAKFIPRGQSSRLTDSGKKWFLKFASIRKRALC